MESELRDEARPINPIGGQIKSGLKKYIYCAQTQKSGAAYNSMFSQHNNNNCF